MVWRILALAIRRYRKVLRELTEKWRGDWGGGGGGGGGGVRGKRKGVSIKNIILTRPHCVSHIFPEHTQTRDTCLAT